MNSLLFAVNAVLPIILVVAVGYFLKRIGFMSQDFVKMANRLVFHVFLPAKLFLNVYQIENLGEMKLGYAVYVVAMLLGIFAVSIPLAVIVAGKPERRGALLQASFRSNYALIGIPLAESLFGASGVAVASLLSAIVVPALNVLAVISLSIFGGDGKKTGIKSAILGILKNPLIQSVLVGLAVLGVRYAFAELGISFRLSSITPAFTAIDYLGRMATPLALIALGGQFEFSVVSGLKREIIFGTLMRTVIVPAIGIGTAFLLFKDTFGGAEFAAFVAVFATPVSISSVPMTQEMGGDVQLAGQLVVWTTAMSAISVFLTSFLLSAAGIF